MTRFLFCSFSGGRRAVSGSGRSLRALAGVLKKGGRPRALLAGLPLLACCAWGQGQMNEPVHEAAHVSAVQAWARATVPGQQMAGLYLTLRATAPARLTGVSSPLAERIEIHEMARQGDVTHMRALPALALPAKQCVALKPGGKHLMLMGLKQALTPRDVVPLTLRFESRDGTQSVLDLQVPVRALGQPDPPPHPAGGQACESGQP